MDGADNVIATSGLDGNNYFENFYDSKRLRAADNTVSTEDKNIQFMKDIGWLTNEDDVKQVTLETSVARPSNTSSRPVISSDVKFGSRKGKQEIAQNNNGRRLTSACPPSAHRISDSIPLFDPKEAPEANPYYSGAAIGGATVSFALKNDTKRKDMKTYKGSRQQSSGDRRTNNGSGNKSYVYRK
jgi:hypothetical protein